MVKWLMSVFGLAFRQTGIVRQLSYRRNRKFRLNRTTLCFKRGPPEQKQEAP